MISLSDLRARNVSPTWQEAVAVVQELVQTVIAGGGGLDRIPDLEHVALIPNGDVLALPGGPIPEQPVRHLASMLGTLLEGTNAPGELTTFVERNVTFPPQFDTPDEFSKQLAFFERPGRRQDVERLVSRALAAEAQTRADEELRRLKDRAAEAAERSPLEDTLMMERPRNRSRLPIAIAAAIAVVGIAGAVLYRANLARHGRAAAAQAQARQATEPQPGAQAGGQTATGEQAGGQTPPAGETPARAGGQTQARDRPRPAAGQTQAAGQAAGSAPPAEQPSLVARAAGAFRSAVAAVLGSSTTEKPKAETETASSATPETRKAKPKPHAHSATPAATPTKAPPSDVASVSSEPTTGGPPTSVAATVATPPEAIYSSADAAVVPPVMVRPVLPASPPAGLSPDQIGTLDLVIDETGRVSQVKLSSPTNRYQDRMLVAHAKSWVFKPALLDGQPVKYRTRVRVTI